MADFTKLSEYLYSGLSTDTKPTASTTTIGAHAVETNTGADYINNGTAWVEMSPKTRT